MLDSQKALVTGGAHGLGQAIAQSLRNAHFEVLAPSSAELNVCDSDAVKRFVAGAGELDLLVVNAGVTADSLLGRMKESDWDRVMEVNLKGAFVCAREVARQMVKRRCGHIVFISSFSAAHPPAGQANYAASKSALIGLMKSMAQELGGRNIRVNAIFPGFLETAMTENLPDSVKERCLEAHVLGRLNTPDSVGRFVTFLHREMPHTSGQVFNLDSRIL